MSANRLPSGGGVGYVMGHELGAYLNSATEQKIQKAICQYLTVKGIPYSVTNASIHYENGQPRRRVGTDGWPDVTACWQGKFLGIEVKSYSGKLRPAQIECHKKIEAAGGLVVVARCVDDVMKVVEVMKQR